MNRFIAFILLFITSGSYAQMPADNLYMPLDFRKAYDNQTRSYDGKPGSKFWQNTCNYTISVAVEPIFRRLRGKEQIEYFNNSNDTLKSIVINTYQDVYRRGSHRDYPFLAESSGSTITKLVIGGKTYQPYQYYYGQTLHNIPLKNPVMPHSSVKIEIEWTVTFLEKGFMREGFVDATSAFIGLWYPKIAVYDDIFGWNMHNYGLKEEFYSPLSSYDVSISLPAGYFVWATGVLQNTSNYPPIVNERLERARKTGEVVSILDTKLKYDDKQTGSDPWHFVADSVPDFAFAFSNHYLWDAAYLRIGERDVLISSAYRKEEAKVWKDHTQLLRDAIKMYSETEPGIAYPYPVYTLFTGNAGGGMEYPMMSFDASTDDDIIDKSITIHEMLHSFLPFYLRTDETRYAWMDEGFTDFYCDRLAEKLGLDISHINESYKYLSESLDGYGNVPLFTSTCDIDQDNVYGINYAKSSQMLTALENVLGKDVWRNCFGAFAVTWKHKSPTPFDLFFFTNHYTQQDLTWFWDAWFMRFGYTDLTFVKCASGKDGTGQDIQIRNTGGLPIPFTLAITDITGKITNMDYKADIWKNGPLVTLNVTDIRPVKIEIVCSLVEDFNLKDNSGKPETLLP